MDQREYKFDLGQAVHIPRGRKGKVIDRQPDQDRVETVQCRKTDKGAYAGGDGLFYKSVAHDVNAYRIEYPGDDGKSATDWWHEEMLRAVKS